MWADRWTWPWFAFDLSRMSVAILLIVNFFFGLFLSKWLIAACMVYLVFGLFARVPWKRWFGSRDDA